MPDENNSNIKNVGARTRTKLGPIVVLNYDFDYGPLNHGQISLGQEHFLIKFPFFSLKTIFLFFMSYSNTFSFAKCLRFYIKQQI